MTATRSGESEITLDKITAAALQVFMRYGVQRSSMNDIAVEAGLARQTLYKTYPNKDAILCATIRVQSEVIRQQMLAAWQRAPGVEAQLDVFFDIAILASFDVIRASPHAADMVDGFSEKGRAEIAQVQQTVAADLAQILTAVGPQLRGAGTSPEAYARFLQQAALGLRNAAENRVQLLAMLQDLKRSALALMQPE